MELHIINGPNLNLLGKREPHIYGSTTWDQQWEKLLSLQANQWPNAVLRHFQSNHEGQLIDYIQGLAFRKDVGLVLNAGALTHTSIALADIITASGLPVVEVHISNIFAREAFRHHSYISSVAIGIISGLGLDGYEYALNTLYRRLG